MYPIDPIDQSLTVLDVNCSLLIRTDLFTGQYDRRQWFFLYCSEASHGKKSSIKPAWPDLDELPTVKELNNIVFTVWWRTCEYIDLLTWITFRVLHYKTYFTTVCLGKSAFSCKPQNIKSWEKWHVWWMLNDIMNTLRTSVTWKYRCNLKCKNKNNI